MYVKLILSLGPKISRSSGNKEVTILRQSVWCEHMKNWLVQPILLPAMCLRKPKPPKQVRMHEEPPCSLHYYSYVQNQV